MITYDNFLLENQLWKGTKVLSEKKAIEIFKDKCSDYLNYNKDGKEFRIVRNIESFDKNFYYINPKEYERKSLNTHNYYTLIMNNDPSWKDYPKRKLICRLMKRSSGIPYNVIPFNNTKWGVCSEFDMWASFSSLKKRYRLSDLSYYIRTLHNLFSLLIGRNMGDDNIDEFKHDLKILEKKLQEKPTRFILQDFKIQGDNFMNNNFDIFIGDLKAGNIYDLLVKLFDPVDNDFKVTDVSNFKNLANTSNENEIWTEEECLMISGWEYHNFIKKVQQ